MEPNHRCRGHFKGDDMTTLCYREGTGMQLQYVIMQCRRWDQNMLQAPQTARHTHYHDSWLHGNDNANTETNNSFTCALALASWFVSIWTGSRLLNLTETISLIFFYFHSWPQKVCLGLCSFFSLFFSIGFLRFTLWAQYIPAASSLLQQLFSGVSG